MSEKHNVPVSRDELLFDVEMALGKAERLWPKGPRAGRHDRFKPLALAVANHLALCGIRCFRRPAIGAPSTSDFIPASRDPTECEDSTGSGKPATARESPSRQCLAQRSPPARGEVG